MVFSNPIRTLSSGVGWSPVLKILGMFEGCAIVAGEHQQYAGLRNSRLIRLKIVVAGIESGPCFIFCADS